MTKCPNNCGSLSNATYDGVELETCKKCRGIWLSYGKLTIIVRTKEREWPAATVEKVLASLRRSNVPPLGEDRDLHCPTCGVELDEVNYQGTSNIIVNPCPHLHGVWLDAGELRAIQVYLQYWAKYARENKAQIDAHFDEIEARYEGIRQSVIARGPSMSQSINELIYDALEKLDQRRA